LFRGTYHLPSAPEMFQAKEHMTRRVEHVA